jgi:type II secretory ATPase GspE/PulE/Tfp pilus assembly ATPase PilB-like protein
MKCKLSLVDRLTPLDGKFRFDVDGRFVDVRVSILPLGSGQSIVCRLLDQSASLMKLDDLRMPEDIRSAIRHVISQPQGLFLVTGPTGSGKTTTLYGVLQQLNNHGVKIITIEDPIEFRIKGISQAAVNLKLTFSGALRSMLRQDPDVILVGEIRDSETARIAVQAALTGHIVLSTLHTNSATITMSRLLDLDVDPNALAAAMGGFMAQRLVRVLCGQCKISTPFDDYTKKQMLDTGIDPSRVAEAHEIWIHNPDGCPACNNGWTGRAPVFELILPTPDVRLAVEESNLKSLERAARLQPQYRTLAQHAMEMVLAGETSMIEAMSVTGSTMVLLED